MPPTKTFNNHLPVAERRTNVSLERWIDRRFFYLIKYLLCGRRCFQTERERFSAWRTLLCLGPSGSPDEKEYCVDACMPRLFCIAMPKESRDCERERGKSKGTMIRNKTLDCSCSILSERNCPLSRVFVASDFVAAHWAGRVRFTKIYFREARPFLRMRQSVELFWFKGKRSIDRLVEFKMK